MSKPRIIVLSSDTDEMFNWATAYWYRKAVRDTKQAQGMYAKAVSAIEMAKDVREAIRNLEAAGFEVVRAADEEVKSWLLRTDTEPAGSE